MVNIYGIHVDYTNGSHRLDKYTFAGEPNSVEYDMFVDYLCKSYQKPREEILEALFLFENADGTPSQEHDLYTEIDLDLDETPAEILERLQLEADYEEALSNGQS